MWEIKLFLLSQCIQQHSLKCFVCTRLKGENYSHAHNKYSRNFTEPKMHSGVFQSERREICKQYKIAQEDQSEYL